MTAKTPLRLPETSCRTRIREGREEIWDAIRGKWLALTPEEWVRQQTIGYLIAHRGVDPLLVRQEQSLTLNGTARRADIVVYDGQARPQMVVECKAPQVKLTRETLEQAVRYNLVLRVPYILITNGLSLYCFHFDETQNSLTPLSEIPEFG
ncbi:MAG: type I restriction enzyme HsdR N-terminal domain-containing protein [Rikenellaceae bacterium]|nr:type I restriction enzyme HsdR N-terminal domain-containing protein [Rikenellaceae bacterium]